MTTIKTYEVDAETASRALIDKTGYDEMYKRSVEDNEGFWGRTGCVHRLDQTIHKSEGRFLG